MQIKNGPQKYKKLVGLIVQRVGEESLLSYKLGFA